MSIWIFYFVLSSFSLFEIMIFIMRSRQRNTNIIIVKNIETVPKKRTDLQNSHEMSKVYPKIKKKILQSFWKYLFDKNAVGTQIHLKRDVLWYTRVYVNQKTRI